jgi:hypothetical protein
LGGIIMELDGVGLEVQVRGEGANTLRGCYESLNTLRSCC